jgi:periplasmic protein CpxP/Spy
MKKMLFLLLAAGLSFPAAQAQTTPAADNAAYQGRPGDPGRGPQRSPEQRADMQTQRLTTQLALTAEQQPKVREIFLAQANRMETLRGQRGTADRQAMQQQMKDAMTTTDEQLKTVLTPDQYTKYQQVREQRLEKAKDARKDGKVKSKVKGR